MTEPELMKYALEHGSVCIGYKDGNAIYVSHSTLAQFGLREIKERLGLTKLFPVRTDLSGNSVMVAANSQEEAIERYLNRSNHETT